MTNKIYLDIDTHEARVITVELLVLLQAVGAKFSVVQDHKLLVVELSR